MKHTLTALCILSVIGAATSVTIAQKGLGIKAGLNVASLAGSGNSADGRIGYHLGVIYGVAVTDQFIIQPGVLYTARGAKNIGLNYIEVPINLIYTLQLSDNLFLFPLAGPYLAYGVSGSNDYKFGSNDKDANPFDAGAQVGLGVGFGHLNLSAAYQFGFTNVTKSFDTGTVSGGAAKNRNLMLSVAYNFGSTD